MSFAYLAAPYTHENPAVRDLRYRMINAFAARLMAKGWSIFSPISQSHEMANYLDGRLQHDHEFWMQMDLPLLERAEVVIVLTLEGWTQSRGVTREIGHANHHGIPVIYLAFDDGIPPPSRGNRVSPETANAGGLYDC